MSNKPRLSTDSQERKEIPLASGCFDYFPDALAAVAELSFVGNEKHNPGQPLHWARGKSTDEADCLLRHLLERGTVDTDGIRHSVKVAWRALALLQKELEAVNGLPVSRGSQEPVYDSQAANYYEDEEGPPTLPRMPATGFDKLVAKEMRSEFARDAKEFWAGCGWSDADEIDR